MNDSTRWVEDIHEVALLTVNLTHVIESFNVKLSGMKQKYDKE